MLYLLPKRLRIITVRNCCGKVMFSQVSVCPRGGGERCIPHRQTPSPGRHAPGKHPPSRQPLQRTGTHPTGMHSCWHYILSPTVTIPGRIQDNHIGRQRPGWGHRPSHFSMYLKTIWYIGDGGGNVQLIFTALKRSLGQGNIFTGVCLSTGEGVCLAERPLWTDTPGQRPPPDPPPPPVR